MKNPVDLALLTQNLKQWRTLLNNISEYDYEYSVTRHGFDLGGRVL
jgi:hypothetical protein